MGGRQAMNDRLHENDDSEIEPSAPPAVPELSQLMVHLLKGVLYRDDDERLWASLLRLQARVREQAAVLLLDLVLEAEGHAFLKSRPDPDEPEGAPRLPRLVARRPLSYPASLMLALLRKRMAEFDAAGGDTRLVLSRDEIAELMRVFLPEGSNEARLVDQVDATDRQGGRAGVYAPTQARGRQCTGPRPLRGAAHPQGLRGRAVAGRLRCPSGNVSHGAVRRGAGPGGGRWLRRPISRSTSWPTTAASAFGCSGWRC
jgi:hypothetical protein